MRNWLKIYPPSAKEIVYPAQQLCFNFCSCRLESTVISNSTGFTNLFSLTYSHTYLFTSILHLRLTSFRASRKMFRGSLCVSHTY